jgi:hypothetical protein
MLRTDLRSVALRPTEERVVIHDDGAEVAKGKGEAAENKAQFGKFLDHLRADPKYQQLDIAADMAYGTIEHLADSGKPLTAKLVAQAYQHGDILVQKFVDTQKYRQDANIERAVNLASDTAVLDHVVAEASGGEIAKLSDSVSKETLKGVKGDIADAIRAELPKPDGSAVVDEVRDKPSLLGIVKTAVAKTIDKIRGAVASATGGPPVASLAAERVKPVVEQIKAFSAQRLNAKLMSSAGANGMFEQKVLREMGAQIGKLDNNELLKLYRTTLSADMLEFRLALGTRQGDPMARSLLEDLNSYEGMVHMEMAERSLQGAREDEGFELVDRGPKGGQLGALASAEKRAADREMNFQSDSYLRGEDTARTEHPGATAKLTGSTLTPKQVADAMRSADLTINLSPKLFAKGGPFLDDAGKLRPGGAHLKNIYELPQGGDKGTSYVDRRQIIEHGLEPATQRADKSGVDPSNHPISAALDVGKRTGGAAGTAYGTAFVVLKDSVKERSTFTPRDAFYAYEAHVTPKSIAAYKHAVSELLQPGSALSETGRKALSEHPTALAKIFTELDKLVDQSFGVGHPETFEDAFRGGLLRDLEMGSVAGVTEADVEKLFNAAIDIFMDKTPGGSHVTTPERLSHLIADLDQQNVLKPITSGIDDPRRVNLEVSQYIEAQVYGGVDLANDVKEIHFRDDDVRFMTAGQKREFLEARAGAEQMAKELGVPLVLFKMEDTEVTRLGTDSTLPASFPELEGSAKAASLGSLNDFRKTELPTLLDKYKEHEQTFDPTGIHGRRHISRALVYSNVLANIIREKGGEVDSNALYTATALHDAGRQGNGTDLWEKDSAAVATARLKERGIDNDDYLGLVEATIDSQSDPSMKSLEGGILKSADSLDIIRVFGKEGYKTDLLWFQHHDMRIGEDSYMDKDDELRGKLVDEVAAFIEATEPKTPSEGELDDARKRMGELGAEMLKPMSSGDMAKLTDEHSKLSAAIEKLADQVEAEHKEMNAGLSSADIFAGIESELLTNPDKYPTLAKYYDPSR